MLKVCIIGCGMIADSAHIPAYKYFSDTYDIAAVCDVSEEAARGTAERHGIPMWYTDAERMIRAEKPDVVSVCAPNFLHKKYTLLALSLGANVICEKPLAVTYADALEMFDLAREKNLSLLACQSMRFTPDRLAAKKYIEENGIGELYYGEFSRIRRRGIPYWGKFHMSDFSLGGAMCDIGVHMLDALVWLCDCPEIASVCAKMGQNHKHELGDAVSSGALTGTIHNVRKFNPDEMDVEDFASGTVTFKNGASVGFKVAWAANLPDSTEIRVVGRDAGILLPEGKVLSGASDEVVLSPVKVHYDSPFAGHFFIIKNMGEHLEKGAELFVKPKETLTVSAITEMMYLSARLGREVTADEVMGKK